MKKLLVCLLAGFLVLAGCASKKQEDKNIKVAVHSSAMIEIMEIVKDDLAKEGYTVEIVKATDFVQPNVMLNNKEVDANFFQHELFMNNFNQKNKGNLVLLQKVYNPIVAFYSKKYKTVNELPENATVAIYNDPANMSRALHILALHNLITFKDPNSFVQSVDTIATNPKNLQFTAVAGNTINAAYDEKDIVFNYPSYAKAINLTPLENGVLLEKESDAKFAISLVAREDNKESAKIKAIHKAITSEKVKKFIEEKLKGHSTSAF